MQKFLKNVSIFLMLIVTLVSLSACSQHSYGNVEVSTKEFNRIKTEKRDISALITDLQRFKYDDKETYNHVVNDVNKLNNELKPGLNNNQRNQLDKALGDNPTGIIGIVKNAVANKYNFDDEVASQFHANFRIILDLTAYPLGNSAEQRNKIETQIRKDINLDSELYKIGSN